MKRYFSSLAKSGLVVLGVMLLQACQQFPDPKDYFPLEKGLKWHYRVSEQLVGQDSRDKEREHRFSIENLGEIALGGEFADQEVSIRRTSDDTEYYILKNDDGVYRIGKRTQVELKPRFDKEMRTILPIAAVQAAATGTPLTSTVVEEMGSENEAFAVKNKGLHWYLETQPYILHATSSHSLPDPKERRFNLAFDVISTTAEVRVPAGMFKNCIQLQGKGAISFYADPRIGYQEVIITQTEWYAPGVGLVKLVREEPLNLEIYKGGHIHFELTRFEQ